MSKYMQEPATLHTRFEDAHGSNQTPSYYVDVVRNWLDAVKETGLCDTVEELRDFLDAGEV